MGLGARGAAHIDAEEAAVIAVWVFLGLAVVGMVWGALAPQYSPSEFWAAVLTLSSIIMLPVCYAILG